MLLWGGAVLLLHLRQRDTVWAGEGLEAEGHSVSYLHQVGAFVAALGSRVCMGELILLKSLLGRNFSFSPPLAS